MGNFHQTFRRTEISKSFKRNHLNLSQAGKRGQSRVCPQHLYNPLRFLDIPTALIIISFCYIYVTIVLTKEYLLDRSCRAEVYYRCPLFSHGKTYLLIFMINHTLHTGFRSKRNFYDRKIY